MDLVWKTPCGANSTESLPVVKCFDCGDDAGDNDSGSAGGGTGEDNSTPETATAKAKASK